MELKLLGRTRLHYVETFIISFGFISEMPSKRFIPYSLLFPLVKNFPRGQEPSASFTRKKSFIFYPSTQHKTKLQHLLLVLITY